MTRLQAAQVHPQDGDMIRLLDGEMDAGEVQSVREHLGECGECKSRLEALAAESEAASRYLAGVLAATPVDEMARARAHRAAHQTLRSHRGERVWARAAAVVAILAVGGLSVSPLRAWVLDRLGGLRPHATMSRAVPVRPAPDVGGAVVSFHPGGSAFVIRLSATQPSGTLTVRRAEGELASAQVVGGTGESLTVLPGSLLVENGAGSTADYALALPASVSRVDVVAGGVLLRSLPLDASTAPGGYRVPLQAPPPGH